MSMYEKIDDLIATKFSIKGDEETVLLYSIDDDDEYIETALENLFIKEGYESHEFNIEIDTVFSSPAVNAGYISIAFIDWGRLHHTVYKF